MAIETKIQLKTYFEAGDQPSEAQFASLIDSLAHVDDIPKTPEIEAEPDHVVLTYSRTGTVASHGTQTTSFVPGNYRGFRSEIGDQYASFRYLKFKIEPASAGDEPTQVTASIKSGGLNTTPLVSKTISIVRGSVGIQQEISIDFGKVVTAGVGLMLYLEVTANGQFGMVGTGDVNVVLVWTPSGFSQGTTSDPPDGHAAAWGNIGTEASAYRWWCELWATQTLDAMRPVDLLQAGIFDNLTANDAQDIYDAIESLLPANNGIEVHPTPLAGPVAAAGASVSSGTWIRVSDASEGLQPNTLFYYE